jgi:hypothetical protein
MMKMKKEKKEEDEEGENKLNVGSSLLDIIDLQD